MDKDWQRGAMMVKEPKVTKELGVGIEIDYNIFENDVNGVYNINNGNYNKSNFYWKCYHLEELINHLKDNHKEEILKKLKNIKALYEHMSKYYQSTKINNEIPLK